MSGAGRREWLGVSVSAAFFAVGLLLCVVLISRSSRQVRVLSSLAGQLQDVAGLEARLGGVSDALTTLESVAVAADATVPRASVSEVLMGEAFQLEPAVEPLGTDWSRQTLRLTSHAIPASKVLALLPQLCGAEHRYRLAALNIRALPGRRGLVEVDARFERLVVAH